MHPLSALSPLGWSVRVVHRDGFGWQVTSVRHEVREPSSDCFGLDEGVDARDRCVEVMNVVSDEVLLAQGDHVGREILLVNHLRDVKVGSVERDHYLVHRECSTNL